MNVPASSSILRSLLLLVFLGITMGSVATAQISIDPRRIIILPGQRSLEVTITNERDNAYEVNNSVTFGLWRADSLGQINIDTVPRSESDTKISCDKWLRVFPQQFTLPPRTSRKVRLMVVPPGNLPDREYMARLVVSSTEVAVPSTAEVDTTKITTVTRVQLNLMLPVMYRKGKVETGVEFTALRMAALDSARTAALVDINPLGNAGYRGTLYGQVEDASGTVVAQDKFPIDVEVPLRRALNFGKLKDGGYKLTVESRAERTGTAAEIVIPAPPVKRTYDLRIAGNSMQVTPTN